MNLKSSRSTFWFCCLHLAFVAGAAIQFAQSAAFRNQRCRCISCEHTHTHKQQHENVVSHILIYGWTCMKILVDTWPDAHTAAGSGIATTCGQLSASQLLSLLALHTSFSFSLLVFGEKSAFCTLSQLIFYFFCLVYLFLCFAPNRKSPVERQ